MKIKFTKIHKRAQVPAKAHESDAGWDLVATEVSYSDGVASNLYMEYGTGICVEIPRGYVGLVFPRSSISTTKHNLRNSVGVIDSGYRGEIKLRFSTDHELGYTVGDKIGQILFVKLPKIEMQEVDSLSDSPRGEEGFGSSGR